MPVGRVSRPDTIPHSIGNEPGRGRGRTSTPACRCAHKTPSPRDLTGYKHNDFRIVALGAPTPLMNQYLPEYGHRDFFLNAVRWLTGSEDENIVGESSRNWVETRLKWSWGIDQFLFWVPIFLFPGIVIGVGGFVFMARRS